MNKEPLVSVIMPVLNNEKYVAEAIDSVLGQTYKKIELICINDGSTDGTLDIFKSYGNKITIINNAQNLGIAASRNKGIEISKGEYIALMDGDDIWKLSKLEKQLEEFEKDKDLDICFCLMQCFISEELPEEIKKTKYCNSEPAPGQIPGASLIKKTSFDKVGYFDPQWKIGEFIDWVARSRNLNQKNTTVNEVLYMRRIHETNTGIQERDSRADYLKIIKKALDQKRNGK